MKLTQEIKQELAKDGLELRKYPEFQDNEEVVLLAVKENGFALEFASKRLQNKKEIVIEAVKEDCEALYYASDDLRDNPEIVLIAMQERWGAIDYASERLQKIIKKN